MNDNNNYIDKIKECIENLKKNPNNNEDILLIEKYSNSLLTYLDKSNDELTKQYQDKNLFLNELIKRENFFKSIYNNIDVAIFVIDIKDNDFIFAGLNPTHEKLTGLKNSLVRGKRPEEFLSADVAKVLKSNYTRCLELKKTIEYEEMLFFNNKETWWLTRLIPIFNDETNKIIKIIGTSLHITELKKNEKEAKKYHNFLETLIDTIPEPVFYKNKNLEYIGCNKAFENLLGINKSFILNKTVFEISPKNLADEYDEKDKELISNPPRQSYDFKIKNNNDEKIVRFNKAVYYDENNNIQGIIGIIHDITDQKKHEKLLENLAIKDNLTNIFNRRGFDELSNREWKSAIRNKFPVSILMIDVDDFKIFNDTYGHQSGDDCLIKVSKTIEKSCFRTTDIVARFGGEEFIILLPNTEFDNALLVADRINNDINKLDIKNQNSKLKRISVSIGIASAHPEKNDDIENLINESDKCLYNAKAKGKNRVEGFRIIS